MIKIPTKSLLLIFLCSSSLQPVLASDYVIDTESGHAYIQFKISHLDFSWLTGRFNAFSGEISYTESKPSEAKIEAMIDTRCIDSNHAERDKHFRDEDFLNVAAYP
ncbi:YceI family protein [Candidatus Thiodiazotropha sp. CDECU1]|uniref:YceI family protein n=1 Tax=Candidatus Thiodiazotropha sp. CDECU1 TaxID=3065865 RepID=UPI00293025EE|nr:YceI family protein [Candidatus Thiodiazotropha sp. CDECU1]